MCVNLQSLSKVSPQFNNDEIWWGHLLTGLLPCFPCRRLFLQNKQSFQLAKAWLQRHIKHAAVDWKEILKLLQLSSNPGWFPSCLGGDDQARAEFQSKRDINRCFRPTRTQACDREGRREREGSYGQTGMMRSQPRSWPHERIVSRAAVIAAWVLSSFVQNQWPIWTCTRHSVFLQSKSSRHRWNKTTWFSFSWLTQEEGDCALLSFAYWSHTNS